MIVLGIDPGTTESGWVVYHRERRELLSCGLDDNWEMIHRIRWWDFRRIRSGDELYVIPDWIVVERIRSYGMAVGQSVFDTCEFAGRFLQEAEAGLPRDQCCRMFRGDVKMHLCGTGRAKDSNVRQVVMDRFGENRHAAVGTKKNPGPLYGVHHDIWQALALAISFAETR